MSRRITIEEAAELLRTSEMDIRKHILCDTIPYEGGFRMRDLNAFMRRAK